MRRTNIIALVLSLLCVSDTPGDDRTLQAQGQNRGKDTVMIFSINDPGFVQLSGPEHIDLEARAFVKGKHPKFEAKDYKVSVVLHADQKQKYMNVYYLDKVRERGWVVEMDTFRKPKSLLAAGKVDFKRPTAPDAGRPLLLLERQDGSTYRLEDLDAEARRYLKKHLPDFDPAGKPRIYRIWFRDSLAVSLGYLDEDLGHGLAVGFSEGVPTGQSYYEEPN